jgi:hypothetical protein
MPDNYSATVPAQSYPWSENTRGIVSVLLVAHLFGLGLIFWANNDVEPSRNTQWLGRTKQKITPPLFALWLDRKWDCKIANGDEIDADHALRFVVRGPDGKPFEAARFPKETGNLPEERERWQQFANDLARDEELEKETGLDNLLKFLAKNWLTQQRAAGTPYDSVTIEVRRRNRVSLEGDLRADPYHSFYYPQPPYGDNNRKVLPPVEVSWPGGEGEPILRKLGGEKRDQAPVVPSKKTPAAPKPQPMATPQPMPMPQPQPIIETPPMPAPQPVTPPTIDVPPAGN